VVKDKAEKIRQLPELLADAPQLGKTALENALPSVAFYRAIGDFLAAAAMEDWSSADEISIAVALDSWKPTRGARLAGERKAAPECPTI
jgi:hypothetical protein